MEISAVALKGKKFGRLTVLKILERIGHDRFILCRCECGSTLEVRKSCLKSGNTRSCGCLQREEARAKRLRHGHTIGGKKTKEHRAWLNIKSRCLGRDPHKRKYYKDRGITISRKLSNSFEAFLKEVGLAPSPNHSIERIKMPIGLTQKTSTGSILPSFLEDFPWSYGTSQRS